MWTWRLRVSIGALGLLVAASALARTAASPGPQDCQRAARFYETRCLMPRIAARLALASDGGAARFVTRMAVVEDACAEATAVGLETCAQWPRVRPTADYRRWLHAIRASWQREQAEGERMRPACPAGAFHCF